MVNITFDFASASTTSFVSVIVRTTLHKVACFVFCIGTSTTDVLTDYVRVVTTSMTESSAVLVIVVRKRFVTRDFMFGSGMEITSISVLVTETKKETVSIIGQETHS